MDKLSLNTGHITYRPAAPDTAILPQRIVGHGTRVTFMIRLLIIAIEQPSVTSLPSALRRLLFGLYLFVTP